MNGMNRCKYLYDKTMKKSTANNFYVEDIT